MMDLYYSPLACSLATRIALYEAGVHANYIEVDGKTKRTSDGSDFREVHPLGLVPTLRTDDGDLLLESAAILQYVASRFPDAELAPHDECGRARLQQWLSFISTELHKALFVPLLDDEADGGAKLYARSKAASRLELLEEQLGERPYLLERFSVADAYLLTILNWAAATSVDLTPYPNLRAHRRRLLERPAVARAMSEEVALFRQEQARNERASPAATDL
jgi:glutathione S-transferase